MRSRHLYFCARMRDLLSRRNFAFGLTAMGALRKAGIAAAAGSERAHGFAMVTFTSDVLREGRSIRSLYAGKISLTAWNRRLSSTSAHSQPAIGANITWVHGLSAQITGASPLRLISTVTANSVCLCAHFGKTACRRLTMAPVTCPWRILVQPFGNLTARAVRSSTVSAETPP